MSRKSRERREKFEQREAVSRCYEALVLNVIEGIKNGETLSPVLDWMPTYSTVILADNLTQFIYDTPEDMDEFVNVAPPFPNFFIDYDMKPGFQGPVQQPMRGTHFVVISRDMAEKMEMYEYGSLKKLMSADTEWVYSIQNYTMSEETGQITHSRCTLFACVNKTGQLLKKHIYQYVPDNVRFTTPPDEVILHKKIDLARTRFALFVLQFMNCKNVELVDRKPSEKFQRFAKRRSIPSNTYKVLKVHTTRKAYPDGESSDGDHDPKRLHIVRGHFAHYTEDKPLFGKYTGTFWRPAHVRGDESMGVVVKDYEVVTDEGDKSA